MDKLIDLVDPDKILYENVRSIIKDYIFTMIPKRECEIFKDSMIYKDYKGYEMCMLINDMECNEWDESDDGESEYNDLYSELKTLYGYHQNGKFLNHQPTYNSIILEIGEGYNDEHHFLGSIDDFFGNYLESEEWV